MKPRTVCPIHTMRGFVRPRGLSAEVVCLWAIPVVLAGQECDQRHPIDNCWRFVTHHLPLPLLFRLHGPDTTLSGAGASILSVDQHSQGDPGEGTGPPRMGEDGPLDDGQARGVVTPATGHAPWHHGDPDTGSGTGAGACVRIRAEIDSPFVGPPRARAGWGSPTVGSRGRSWIDAGRRKHFSLGT